MSALQFTAVTMHPRLFVVPVPAALADQASDWFAHHPSPSTALLGMDEAWFLDADQADAFAAEVGAHWE